MSRTASGRLSRDLGDLSPLATPLPPWLGPARSHIMLSSDLDLARALTSLRMRRRAWRRLSFWVLLFGSLMCLAYVLRLYRHMQAPRDSQEGGGGEGGGGEVELQPPMPVEGVERPEEPALPRDQEPVTLLHYLWCDVSYFDFRHYLALKGAVRALRPESVLLHYTALPRPDPEAYYTWFQRLQTELPHMVTLPLNSSRCPPPGAPRYQLVLGLLHRYGGVYVPPLALLVIVPLALRSLPFASGVLVSHPSARQDGLIQGPSPRDFKDGIILAHRGAFPLPADTQKVVDILHSDGPDKAALNPCHGIPEFNTATEDDVICVQLPARLHPRDIWESRDRLAMLARMVAYGDREVRPRRDVTRHVPRVAHVICPGACALPFSAYLSLLSAVHVGGMSRVYLHGQTTPQGRWWRKLQNDTRFVHVYRELPETTEQHATPLLASNLLLKYGGVYQSLSVLWVRAVPPGLWEGEAVLALDRRGRGAWPEGVSVQLMLARRGAPFMHSLHTALHAHVHEEGALPARYVAYRLLELEPQSAVLEPRLLVECQGRRCHPGWEEGHRVEPHPSHVIPPEGDGAWLREAIAVHVTTLEELDPDTLKYSGGEVVRLARTVLEKANVDLKLL